METWKELTFSFQNGAVSMRAAGASWYCIEQCQTSHKTVSFWVRGNSCAPEVVAHQKSLSLTYSVKTHRSMIDLASPVVILRNTCIVSILCTSEFLGVRHCWREQNPI